MVSAKYNGIKSTAGMIWFRTTWDKKHVDNVYREKIIRRS